MLRDYQTKAINNILESFNDYDSVMLQMPTGTGKTTVFSELVKRWIREIKPNQRVLILVHRKELVDQAIERLKRSGVLSSRIQSGFKSDLIKQVQVGMVQSMRKKERMPQNVSLIIIDEAHHTPASSYRSILENYQNKAVKILGVTATPCRTNGQGFTDIFQKLIVTDSIQTFINNGFLANIKHKSISLLDLANVRIKRMTNDYDERELDKIVRNKNIIADLVESYIKYANGKKAIVFTLNKDHSIDVVKRFNEKGISATYIDSDTDKEKRDKIVDLFKLGEYKVLCNVNIFTEGFDCPDIEVVQLARPTKSFSLYLQQVGRVMRPSSSKDYGLIIDNAGLFAEHGLVTRDILWSLKDGLLIKETNTGNSKSSELSRETQLPTEIKDLELVDVDDTKILPEINKNRIEDCILNNEELVFLFQDQIRYVKDYAENLDLIQDQLIHLAEPMVYATRTIFPININKPNSIYYILGFTNNLETSSINIGKLYSMINALIDVNKYDFFKEQIYVNAYQFLKLISSSENIDLSDPYKLIRQCFPITSKNKAVNNTYYTKIYNFLYNEQGGIKKSTYKSINQYSETRFKVYSQIITKLNLRKYNNDSCLIFGK